MTVPLASRAVTTWVASAGFSPSPAPYPFARFRTACRSHRHDISECPAPVSRGVKECRDIYVTDEMVALVYQCASPVIQDAIDLACPTAQRPAESLRCDGITSRMVRSGLSKERPKQDYRLDIVGEFAALIDRIKSRGIVGMTLFSDPKGQRLKHSSDFRRQFKLARDRA